MNLDGKQVQRWSEAMGRRVVGERQAEVLAYEQGRRPESPANAPQVLVIGVDGGRVQTRQKDEETASRWREDKVVTVTTYLRGDGQDRKPQKLVTSHVATMEDAHVFGKLARVEAERRGIRSAEEAVLMGDCGNWIDPLGQREFPHLPRIADYDHAVEHLWEATRAVLGVDDAGVGPLAGRLEGWLYDGKLTEVIGFLETESAKLGPVREGDGEHHPRRVLAVNAGYFKRNQQHMNYPEYRRKGWPIGSGNTEAGVKQFNKRVKGTEQFWEISGVETILALRGLWISQDERWPKYWAARPAYSKAA